MYIPCPTQPNPTPRLHEQRPLLPTLRICPHPRAPYRQRTKEKQNKIRTPAKRKYTNWKAGWSRQIMAAFSCPDRGGERRGRYITPMAVQSSFPFFSFSFSFSFPVARLCRCASSFFFLVVFSKTVGSNMSASGVWGGGLSVGVRCHRVRCLLGLCRRVHCLLGLCPLGLCRRVRCP